MSLQDKIETAFAHREAPSETVNMEGRFQIDSDVDDALWFKNRNWRELTCEDWHKHHWGFFFFSQVAFAYYLPSLLILTVQNPKSYPDLAIDSLFLELDRSPGAENLDPPLIDRYSALTVEEFDVIREWLLFACESIPNAFWGAALSGPGDGFGRVFDTINLLQKETALEERPSNGILCTLIGIDLRRDKFHHPTEHDHRAHKQRKAIGPVAEHPPRRIAHGDAEYR